MNSRHANRQALKKQFEAELARLNPAQREAVTHIEGPMLVLAGPGTGKTHVLAARIGFILLETDARPQDVLCLTYTEAATQAMRERLVRLIGPNEAYRVPVSTYHAFCNRVIKEHPQLFSTAEEAMQATELQRIQLLKDILLALPADHPLRRNTSDGSHQIKDLFKLFERIKKEKWEPETMALHTEQWIEQLPQLPEYQYQKNIKSRNIIIGDVKINEVQEDSEKYRRFAAACRLYDSYRQAMLERQFYDFDDMVLWVLEAFVQHPWLLQRYQEQFLYVLVDEYQDTNGAQNQLLQQLMVYWDSPNLFVVGDDDQSIFEFQGARIEGIIELYDRYQPEIKIVVLEENYRSTQQILDAARDLIEENELRLPVQMPQLGLQKIITAVNAPGPKPTLTVYPTPQTEVAAVVENILELIKSGHKPAEIAIICYRHKDYEPFRLLLEKSGVSCFTRRLVDAFQTLVGEHLLRLVAYLQNERTNPGSGERDIYEVLHQPWFGLDARQLSLLSYYVGERGFDRGWVITEADLHLMKNSGIENGQAVVDTFDLFDQLIALLSELPLLRWFEVVLDRAGIVGWAAQEERKLENLPIITSLFDFIAEQMSISASYNVYQLMQDWDDMRRLRISLPVQSLLNDPAGVHLLTAHGAKGLEYEAVFMPQVLATQWEDHKGQAEKFKYPALYRPEPESDAIEAKRRLFFVAMTRSKRLLHFSYPTIDPGVRTTTLSPSRFLQEINADLLDQRLVSLTAEALVQAQVRKLAPVPRALRPPTALIERFIGSFSWSPTSFDTFLDCKLGFYYRYILRVPSGVNEPLIFGQCVHSALETWGRQTLKTQQPAHKDLLLTTFQSHLLRKAHLLPRSGVKQLLELGQKVLSVAHDKYLAKPARIQSVETLIAQTEIGGVPVQGKIDRIELNDRDQWVIIDYKTGKTDKPQPPKKGHLNGNTTWRQLTFYRLLLATDPTKRDRDVASAAIWPLRLTTDTQLESPELLTFDLDQDELFIKLLQNADLQLRSHDIFDGCGKKDCNWCQFATRYGEISAEINEQRAEIDDF
jgi:DNA helicase II / ATP-dependent DNA helicase PcrA